MAAAGLAAFWYARRKKRNRPAEEEEDEDEDGGDGVEDEGVKEPTEGFDEVE